MTTQHSSSLFTYGSLMCEDIMFAIAGPCECVGQAKLHGYQRRPVRGETYPGIMPHPGSSVSGVLYTGISGTAMQALDRFEGNMYQRDEVQLILQDNTLYTAFTYVVRPGYRHQLENRHWDVEHFLRDGKTRFISLYEGFRSFRADE